MNDLKIFIATHKEYSFPNDSGYQPIHVGKSCSNFNLGIPGDDIGENISYLNPYYCELTALYWIWKNTHFKKIGLVHYRRYFSSIFGKNNYISKRAVCHSEYINKLLNNYDIILPKKRYYLIESVYSHFCNAHYENDLIALFKIIKNNCPDYYESLEQVFYGRSLHLYNMFITNRTLFNSYMEWMFPLLFELQKLNLFVDYGPYQQRVFGFLAERLFNVWIKYNFDNIKIKYLRAINLDSENIPYKAYNLLKRKYLKIKID